MRNVRRLLATVVLVGGTVFALAGIAGAEDTGYRREVAQGAALPFTGGNTGLLVGIGAALLVLGGAAIVATRRRRHGFVGD